FSPSPGVRRHPSGAGRSPRGDFPMTELFPLGEVPKNLGELPRKMLAWCIRPDREGDPDTAMRLEEVAIPEVGPNEALVLVMGAGVNFNGVWAARGKPVRDRKSTRLNSSHRTISYAVSCLKKKMTEIILR